MGFFLPQKVFFVFILFGILASFTSFSKAQTIQQIQAESAFANIKKTEAKKILDQFFKIRTVTGRFIQISPYGKKTEGTFYLERPGKVRFSYDNAPIYVIADGKSFAINNTKLGTWDLYQLHQTPIKFLLGTHINLDNSTFLDYQKNAQTIIITLTDRSLGKAKVSLFFSPKDLTLQQWVTTDHQNLQTTVRFANIRTNVQFSGNIFKIDYQRIAMKRKL